MLADGSGFETTKTSSQTSGGSVFRVCFWGPNTFSGGVWMSREI